MKLQSDSLERFPVDGNDEWFMFLLEGGLVLVHIMALYAYAFAAAARLI